MTDTAAVSWAAAELAGAAWGDARRNRRVVRVAEQLGAQPGASIPVAGGGWAETPAADRVLAHEHVEGASVRAPHWDCRVERRRAPRGVRWVHDTTELDVTSQPGMGGLGPLSQLRQPGLDVHPTWAVTPDGVPWGVLDVWRWARDRETVGDAHRHWPLEATESLRWLEGVERGADRAATVAATRLVQVAARAGDSHAFMVGAGRWPGSDWLLRASHHRCLAEGDNLWDRVAPGAGVGEVRFSRPARAGRPSRPVVLTGRAKRGTWRPPGGELVTVTARRAREAAPPAGGEPPDWRLLTHRPADTLGPAAERLQWYGSRWRLAVVVRIFKPGGRVEAGQLSTLERLEPALALSLLLAGRSQYRTLLGRATPALPGEAVLDPAEGHAVDVASPRRPPPVTPPPLAVMLGWIARLGGHLGRKHAGPPGPNALGLGVQRARDVAWGRQLMSDIPSSSTAQRCV